MRKALPQEWVGQEQLDGFDLVDKSELEGEPFRIMSVWFTTNDRSVSYVYVEAEKVDGEVITFNDSSTGVRQQIIDHLKNRGQDHVVDTGDVVPLSLVIPRGLRKSEFDTQVQEGNRVVTKKARTYYLTTSGKRASTVVESATEPAPARRRGAAAKG